METAKPTLFNNADDIIHITCAYIDSCGVSSQHISVYGLGKCCENGAVDGELAFSKIAHLRKQISKKGAFLQVFLLE